MWQPDLEPFLRRPLKLLNLHLPIAITRKPKSGLVNCAPVGHCDSAVIFEYTHRNQMF